MLATQDFYSSPLGIGIFLGGVLLVLIVGTIQRKRGQLPYQRADRERREREQSDQPDSA